MYLEPPALHAPEPRHLPLGKLVDGYLKPLEHLGVGGLSSHILRDKLILQAIVHQVFCRYALIEQSAHLVYHPFLQTGLQPPGDFLAPQLSVDADADDDTLHRRQLATRRRMLQVVGLYLDGTDGPLAGVHIGLIMHHRTRASLQFFKHLRQFCQRLALKAVAQLLVLGHRREMIALEHGLDVESRAAAENGHRSPTPYVLIGREEVLLILKEVVLRARLPDVDEVIRNGYWFTVIGYCIVCQVLASADIHPAIHLPGIG